MVANSITYTLHCVTKYLYVFVSLYAMHLKVSLNFQLLIFKQVNYLSILLAFYHHWLFVAYLKLVVA